MTTPTQRPQRPYQPPRQPRPSRSVRAPKTRRGRHPDDILRNLARQKNPMVLPELQTLHRHKPPSNPYVIGLWVLLGLVTFVVAVPFIVPRQTITITGVVDGEALVPQSLATRLVSVASSRVGSAASARIRLDDRVITPAPNDKGEVGFVLGGGLPDGTHHLIVESGSRVLWRSAPSKRISFTVDSVEPGVTAAMIGRPASLESSVTLTGTTEKGAVLTLNDKPISVQPDGGFSVTLPRAPIGSFQFVATDPAGNRSTKMVPGLADLLFPNTRAVHVSFAAWTYEPLRKDILKLIEEGKIDTVQLDIKDEDGYIGHRSEVPMVNQIGASKNMYNLVEEVAILKGLGVRVMGRLVVFRDPVLAKAAWQGQRFEEVLQNSDGTPFSGKYGGFTNPFDQTVRRYNMAIALEAAQAGVDSIVLDYIRRPESPIEKLKFPGVTGEITAERISKEVAGYVKEMGVILNETPVRLGVSVFGVAVQPGEGDNIAQNVYELAKVTDFVAPMVYPSAWTAGQFGVADPPAQPYEIIEQSLRAFQASVDGTGVRLAPWLQDFSLIRKYGPKEVRAQINAAADICIPDWIMWDPKVTYSSDGYPTKALTPADGRVCKVAPSNSPTL